MASIISSVEKAIPLLILLDKIKQKRRLQTLRAFQEPTIRSSLVEEIPRRDLSSNDRLIIACGGDRQRAERLREYEYRQHPGISNEDAAQKAWERLQRDRH